MLTLAGGDHRIDVLGLVGDEVHEHQPVLHLERLLERAFDVAGFFDLHADVAIGLGELHEIRQRIHVRMRIAPVVEELLPLAHHAHVAVVQVHDLDRQVILLAGREFLDAHLDRGLAGDAAHRLLRERELHAHGRGQAKAHGAEPAGVDPATRLVEAVELRGPHLVLAHVRGDIGLALGQIVEHLQYVLRFNELAVAVVVKAVHRAPLVDLLPPDGERVLIRFLLRSLDELDHVAHHGFGTAHDRHLHRHVLRDRRRVDVRVDDVCVRTELVEVAGHAVIKARANGDQHVAFVHRHVGFVGAVHAEHADKQRIVGRVRAEPHERVGAGETEQAHELSERGRGLAQNHAAAGVDHRALGDEHQVHGLLDPARIALRHRVVRTHVHRLRIRVLALVRGHVLGDVHEHRTGAAGGGDIKRLFDRGREVLHVLHQKIVLHARACDADRVHFLERVIADQAGRHLAAEHHQRDRIHVGGSDAGHGVGHARTGGHQHYAGPAGGARVAVGGVRRALLVPYEDVLDLVLPVKRIVDVQRRTAGVAEDVLHAFVRQAADEDVCAG